MEESTRVLESFQNDVVDAILGKIVQTANSKNSPFCMDTSLDQVLQLKVVAMERSMELQ